MAFSNAINARTQGTQYISAAGAPSGIDASTAGYVLTSNGTGAAPSFQAASVGAQTLVVAQYGATVSNVTGDGTVYTLVFGTAQVNIGTAYNTGTGVFTAPATSNYLVSCTVGAEGWDGTSTGPYLTLTTSGGVNFYYTGGTGAVQAGNHSYSFSWMVPLNSADTFTITLQGSGGTKTVDVGGNATNRFSAINIVKIP